MANHNYTCSKGSKISFYDIYVDTIENIKKFENPFNNIYNNIKKISLSGIENLIFYKKSYNENNYDIDYNIHSRYITIPSQDYNWDDIPIFLKEYPELIAMINEKFYYKRFRIENTNIDVKSNVSKAYSINCGDYLLTPTVSPATEDHIVVLGLDRSDNKIFYYTAYDFYLSDKFILDMYHVALDMYSKTINYTDKFTIANSLELGSLPDVYHFHVYKTGLIDQFNSIYDSTQELTDIIKIDASTTTPVIYMVKNLEKNLRMIPRLLQSLRSYYDNSIHYKYMSQIMFIPTSKGIKFLMVFKRINVEYIKLINNNVQYDNNYYQGLFLDSKTYGTYFPCGIFATENDTVNYNYIKAHIDKYVEHPNILNKFMEMNTDPSIITYQSYIKFRIATRDDIVLHREPVILYNINADNTIGRMSDNGNDYTFSSYELENIQDVTLSFCQTFNNQGRLLYKYSPSIRSFFIPWLQSEANALKTNQGVLIFIIVSIIHKIYKLFHKNILIDDLSINDILVTDNNTTLKNFVFNDNDQYINIVASKEYVDGVVGITQGVDVHFRIEKNKTFTKKYNNFSEYHFLQLKKILVDVLNSISILQIYDTIFQKLREVIMNDNSNLMDILNIFSYGNNFVLYKSGAHMFLRYFEYFFYGQFDIVDNATIINRIYRTINKNRYKIEAFFANKKIKINKGQKFITGTNLSGNDRDVNNIMELKKQYNIGHIWTVKIDESLNTKYIDVMHKQYLKNSNDGLNNRSRVVLMETIQDCYVHLLYGEKRIDCVEGQSIQECNNHMLELIRIIFDLEYNYVQMISNHDKIMNVLKTRKHIKNQDHHNVLIFNELQDIVFYLYNIAFDDKINYAGICGSVSIDMITEYIFIDPFKNLTWISSYCLEKSGFKKYDASAKNISNIMNVNYRVTNKIENNNDHKEFIEDNTGVNVYKYKSTRKLYFVFLILLILYYDSDNIVNTININFLDDYVLSNTNNTSLNTELYKIFDRIILSCGEYDCTNNCENYRDIKNNIIDYYLSKKNPHNAVTDILSKFSKQTINITGGYSHKLLKIMYKNNKKAYLNLFAAMNLSDRKCINI